MLFIASSSDQEAKHNFKLLLAAIEDDDHDMVKFRLGDLCHPLCQCDRCRDLIGQTKGVPQLLSTVDDLGRSVLHFAVMLGRSEIVSFLLSKGAPIAARNHLGQTPLHFACQYNRVDIVKVGADGESKTIYSI